MRKLYLIRHARPDIPLGKTRCIGITDVPLGTLGKLQAAVLGEYMKEKPLSGVYCSDLSRAIQTARALCPEPEVVPELREMYAGDWEGLYFDEIRQRWPEIYEKRGIDPSYPIPGAEPAGSCCRRFVQAVEEILSRRTGDVAIVAHATVIQSFLSVLHGTDVNQCRRYALDYTGICTLEVQEGNFVLLAENEIPRVPLSEALCEKLLVAAQAPLEHCREVAAKALAIGEELENAGVSLDPERIRFGALLHDLARREKHHAEVGARWLECLGYDAAASIVRDHHEGEGPEITEKNLVFLADKLPLELRFAASRQKCTTPEARQAHDRRYRAALALKETINALCGKELIV